MGTHEHKAQTRSERLIQAMDRLWTNIERLVAMQSPPVDLLPRSPYEGPLYRRGES